MKKTVIFLALLGLVSCGPTYKARKCAEWAASNPDQFNQVTDTIFLEEVVKADTIRAAAPTFELQTKPLKLKAYGVFFEVKKVGDWVEVEARKPAHTKRTPVEVRRIIQAQPRPRFWKDGRYWAGFYAGSLVVIVLAAFLIYGISRKS